MFLGAPETLECNTDRLGHSKGKVDFVSVRKPNLHYLWEFECTRRPSRSPVAFPALSERFSLLLFAVRPRTICTGSEFAVFIDTHFQGKFGNFKRKESHTFKYASFAESAGHTLPLRVDW